MNIKLSSTSKNKGKKFTPYFTCTVSSPVSPTSKEFFVPSSRDIKLLCLIYRVVLSSIYY